MEILAEEDGVDLPRSAATIGAVRRAVLELLNKEETR